LLEILSPQLLAAAVAVFYLLAIAAAIEAILRGRTAQGAIAWVVSLLTLPYLTLPHLPRVRTQSL
jgi:cardiolipin synthase